MSMSKLKILLTFFVLLFSSSVVADDISDLDVLDELPQIDPDEYEEKEKVTTEALDQFLSGEIEWKDLNDED